MTYTGKCPICGAYAGFASDVCPACGVMFDQFANDPNLTLVPAAQSWPTAKPDPATSGRAPQSRTLLPTAPTATTKKKRPPDSHLVAFRDDAFSYGLLGAIVGFIIGTAAAFIQRHQLSNAAEEAYDSACSGFSGVNETFCAGGVNLAVQLYTPTWAESPFVTGVVLAALGFMVGTLYIIANRKQLRLLEWRCSRCQTPVNTADDFCPDCGYELWG